MAMIFNPKPVLDPLWMCQANFVDLEYYTYVLLDAKQKYLRSLEEGNKSHFYEVAFNYFNLNTVLADKKLYDSSLNTVNSDSKFIEIIQQLSQLGESTGKQLIKTAHSILAYVLQSYVDCQLTAMENLHFYFNNRNLHLLNDVYIVYKLTSSTKYDIYHLSLKSKKRLGYSMSHISSIEIPNLEEVDFKSEVCKLNPSLNKIDPLFNVIVVTGGNSSDSIESVSLVKDVILLNRIVKTGTGFDLNVLRDIERLLETKKSIPFKLKA